MHLRRVLRDDQVRDCRWNSLAVCYADLLAQPVAYVQRYQAGAVSSRHDALSMPYSNGHRGQADGRPCGCRSDFGSVRDDAILGRAMGTRR